MKKLYITLAVVIVIVMSVARALVAAGIGTDSWIINLIVITIALIPVEILLFVLSKDMKVKKPIRIICRIVFWVWLVSYSAGSTIELVEGIKSTFF